VDEDRTEARDPLAELCADRQHQTVQCAICHGPDLKGLGKVPRIVGRSPEYN
jgi:mono/diheme cytochrome c family protein